MLGRPVESPSKSGSPPPRIEHVRGLDAMPLVGRALALFEPAVLMTTEGLGAIHAPTDSDDMTPSNRALWLLADARTLLDWESHRRLVVTLSFQSPDERVYFTLSGRTEVVTDPARVLQLWRPVFKRWFAAGPADPRLLLVKFLTYDAEFYQTSAGRVTAHVTH